MLRINVVLSENYDEEKKEFVIGESYPLILEHSLVSLSKWEEFFQKPFLVDEAKSEQETLAYIEFMILNPEFSPEVISHLSQQNLDEINDYLNRKATATWFNESSAGPKSNEVVTSELIYYWMFANQIDKECETWHLNRLLTLLKIFNFKNAPPKKMSQREALEKTRRLNAERRRQFETSG